MKDGKLESATEIEEGLPSAPPSPISASERDAADVATSIVIEEPPAKQVFIAWEKLRILYNCVLVVVVVIVSGSKLLDFLPNLIEAAIVANLLFCAGPVFEGYANLFGIRRGVARWMVFCVGMLFAVFYTVEVTDRIIRHLPVWEGFPNGLHH